MRSPYLALLLGLLALTGLSLRPAPCQEGSQKEPPYKRVLTGEDARRLAELAKKFDELVAANKIADAVKCAEEVAALRERAQGKDHWQAGQFRRLAQELKRLAALPAEEQQAFASRLSSGQHAIDEAKKLYDRGKYAEAQPLLEKALDNYLKALGASHPHTAHCYNDMALNLDAQGKYPEAEVLFNKALAIQRQSLEKYHPETALTCYNLAANLNAQGKYTQAQSLLQEALTIWRNAVGEGLKCAPKAGPPVTHFYGRAVAFDCSLSHCCSNSLGVR